MSDPKFTEYFPRKFCGDGKQCPQAHFITFERYVKAAKLDATTVTYDQISECFFRTLAEKAIMWMDGQVFTTIKDLKTGFLPHFSGSVGVSGDIQQFYSTALQPGETVREFSYRLTSLATRLDLPASLVKDRFINITFQVLPFYNKGFDEIFDMAQNIASMPRPASTSASANVAEVTDLKSELAKLYFMVEKLASMVEQLTSVQYSSVPLQKIYSVAPNSYHVPSHPYQVPSHMYNAPSHQYNVPQNFCLSRLLRLP